MGEYVTNRLPHLVYTMYLLAYTTNGKCHVSTSVGVVPSYFIPRVCLLFKLSNNYWLSLEHFICIFLVKFCVG